MADLSDFANGSFDLIVHPVSNIFAPNVLPVWAESFRVLRPGGALLSGFMNPALFIFDHDEAMSTGLLQVKYDLPYSDTATFSSEKVSQLLEDGESLEFSHTLTDLIGGQLQAGFTLNGLLEDTWTESDIGPLNKYMPLFIATRAVKPN